jgi:large subunit ribosomal protein L30|uniref:50S ribosomal protein L30 n=1 Tax=candidate division WOR-3 bacterium TaxID=2052148 RepID=A0A7V3VV08_UNCW3
MKKIKVILKKSPIDKVKKHKLTIKALGLRRIGQSRVLPDNPAVRGMIRQVSYMVEVMENVNETE